MCTVTFLPVRDTVLITSSRDEKRIRPAASVPSFYHYNGCRLAGPRDAFAGGTWIALKENGDAAVLLNGAFIKHIPHPPYRVSRGLIFLDLLSHKHPSAHFDSISLAGIEPFTMILFEKGCLYQFRWNGEEKFAKQFPASRPHIWSSATLYDGPAIKKRETWFAQFLNNTTLPTQQDVLHFHQTGGEGDPQNDLQMSRSDIYSTVSITGIHLTKDRGSIKYLDMSQQQTSELKFELAIPATVV
ncbi:MAG: NRDE family protein [Bacteroidetes bacterium]|nr:NRDE family protein [Bacteroidota bacterium]